MSKAEKKANATKVRVGSKYSDSRDNLWATCEHCGAELVEAVVKIDVGGETAHGVYACKSKSLAWTDPRQGPVCVRPCQQEKQGDPRAKEGVEISAMNGALTPEEVKECLEFLAQRGLGEFKYN